MRRTTRLKARTMFSRSTTASISRSLSRQSYALSLPWRLAHRRRCLAASGCYLSGRVRASQPYYPAPPSPTKFKVDRLLLFTFGPSARSICLLWPRLTSAAPYGRLPTAAAFFPPKQNGRPPRVMRTSLHAYARRVYFRNMPGQVLDFEDICLLVRYGCLPRFLCVGPAFCLRLPSDPASQRAPLPSG
jgi:hypothetical protein